MRMLVSNSNFFRGGETNCQIMVKFFKIAILVLVCEEVYPERNHIRLFANKILFANKLNKKTTLLVIPSFNIRYKYIIDSMLVVNESMIRSLTNLIIDIRNNGGGSDESFNKIIPFIYTNPIVRINSDIWSTEDNIKKYESVAADTNYSLATRKEMNAFVLRLKQNINQFVNSRRWWYASVGCTDSLPKKVYIIINGGVASSAEGFYLRLLRVKKLFSLGQHTKGELDYANVNYLISPSKRLSLGCPTSRSRRLPDMPIDNIGIMPDIFLVIR